MCRCNICACIPENDLLLIAEYAVGLGSMRSACLVEYKADDGPELATGHADEKSQRRDQQVGTRRAESERQATYAAFGPIGPEAFVDILSGVQGLRHWDSIDGFESRQQGFSRPPADNCFNIYP